MKRDVSSSIDLEKLGYTHLGTVGGNRNDARRVNRYDDVWIVDGPMRHLRATGFVHQASPQAGNLGSYSKRCNSCRRAKELTPANVLKSHTGV
ncbi:hypothetical protein JJC00_06670 [Bradyrhizobium diazoefficiens]|uniref:hypothetical protein n=1 Tax=Bradyrhizobium diazoefficiens TaxID=1355477 RepID=UPI00190D3E8B|nr:hypothetical protein [Bradyrhizobium diazoefficiens]QQO35359.1 hypothetical protein JJC00_06670 [Bradyrhizobium diazoefficiens]